MLPLYVDEPLYKTTGKIGTILFPGFCINEDEAPPQIDTNKTTYFTKEIKRKNSNTYYTIECGPWFTNNIDEKCSIFCNFNETIPSGEYKIMFDDQFNYLNYEVYVQSFDEECVIKKENDDIIDLYSDTHYINLTDDEEEYELRFKINVYNNEKLFLYFYKIIPIACNLQNNELICPINRTKFENHMATIYKINVISFDKFGNMIIFGLIPEIQVIYDINKKQEIYVEITKLITNYAGNDNYIVYETNVSDIQNVFISDFRLSFDGIREDLNCNFIKGGNVPMLVYCFLNRKNIDEYISLKEIVDEIIIDKASIIYNFRIQPVKIEDKCKIFNSVYSEIVGNYPEVLNFQTKDLYEFEFYAISPENIIGITFNEDKEDLKCSNIGIIKRCIVEKSHFKGKESNYYYIKYNGYNNTKAIAYEVMPIEVILTKRDNDSDIIESDSTEIDSDSGNNNDNDDDNLLVIILSVIGSIVVIIAICLGFYFFYYKKKYSNLEEDVMKTSFKD